MPALSSQPYQDGVDAVLFQQAAGRVQVSEVVEWANPHPVPGLPFDGDLLDAGAQPEQRQLGLAPVAALEPVDRPVEVEDLGILRQAEGGAVDQAHVLKIGGLGGEIEEYTKMMAEAREQALDRMVEEAEELGANAVICTRFMTSMLMQGAAELLAYGTAVIVEDD